MLITRATSITLVWYQSRLLSIPIFSVIYRTTSGYLLFTVTALLFNLAALLASSPSWLQVSFKVLKLVRCTSPPTLTRSHKMPTYQESSFLFKILSQLITCTALEAALKISSGIEEIKLAKHVLIIAWNVTTLDFAWVVPILHTISKVMATVISVPIIVFSPTVWPA